MKRGKLKRGQVKIILKNKNDNLVITAIVLSTIAIIASVFSIGAYITGYQVNGQSGDIYYNGGNVGIGTNNPLTRLDVNGSIRSTGLDYGISYTGKYARLSFVPLGWDPANPKNGDYTDLLSYDSDNKIYKELGIRGNPILLSGGYVGIGTNNPTHRLDVDGNAENTVVIVDSDAGFWHGYRIDTAEGEEWFIGQQPNDDTLLFRRDALLDFMTLSPTGELQLSILSGTGNDYVCVYSSGKLYRSDTPCA
ncbi:MAG TPA: hypothetical protein VJH65_00505 [Candidatus Nanoarchaeia archaeon]|nr:hypothetical protein [Candidatus Nanoarchaeia archaeon]